LEHAGLFPEIWQMCVWIATVAAVIAGVASEGWHGGAASCGSARFHQSENLSGHDAMHCGLGEAELSSNDADAVTLRMRMSNFLAIDNQVEAGPNVLQVTVSTIDAKAMAE